jgi:hypothetical protein
MPFASENEWTVITPEPSITDAMASSSQVLPAPAAESKIEFTINTKPTANPTTIEGEKKLDSADNRDDTSVPKLVRRDSFDSVLSCDDDYRRPLPRVRPNYVRRYSPSPIRVRNAVPLAKLPVVLSTSVTLLDKVDKYDGIADLPYPARVSIYLTTYPFTDKDVKKWSWLFSLGVEETFLVESGRGRGRVGEGDSDEEGGVSTVRPVRRRRDRSPFYNDPGTIDLPSVYLSRALDEEIVPEDTKDVRYLIVIQNRHRPAGSKLLVAESRKAAGMMMYYELLRADSVVFVGAAVGLGNKSVHPKKFMKAETLADALKLKEEGFVGVVC